MTVREAVPADAEQIIAHIHRIAEEPDRMILTGPGEFRSTVAEEQQILAEYAAAENSVYLVAESNGDIRGILSAAGGKRSAERHSVSMGMSVADGWRSQGIGTALMKALVRWAAGNANVVRLELEVFAHNAPAISLYRKFGFVEEGRRRDAYFLGGQYIDALVMTRLWQPPAEKTF